MTKTHKIKTFHILARTFTGQLYIYIIIYCILYIGCMSSYIFPLHNAYIDMFIVN